MENLTRVLYGQPTSARNDFFELLPPNFERAGEFCVKMEAKSHESASAWAQWAAFDPNREKTTRGTWIRERRMLKIHI